MSKRGAEKQLTHDNWDNSDEEEGAGKFQPAGEDVLKSRVIKKARRRVNRSEQQGAAPSPFAAFSGFGATPKPATNTGSLFSFLAKPAAQDDNSNTTALNSLTPKLSNKPPTPSKTDTSNTKSTAAADDEKENMSASPVQARPSIRRSSGSGGGGTTGATPSTPSEYHRQLMALNRCLLRWVQQHVEKSPLCILTPIFKDYDEHLSGIEKKYRGESETEPTATAAAGSVGFSFSADTKQTTTAFSPGTSAAGTDKPALPSSGFSFGAAVSKPTETSASTTKSVFSFGLASDTPAPGSKTESSVGSGFSFSASKAVDTSKESSASSGFSFGLSGGKPLEGTKGLSTGTSGFSFGFGAAAAGKAPPASESTQEDDESDEPPVVEVKTVQEDDAVYSKRCKLFYKKDGSFVEKGVGMLYLKPCKGDKFQCLVRADTNLGNILLNIKLNKSIPTQRMGKNNVMMACVPNPPLDPKLTDSSPVPLLIRVKTGDDADELLQKIDEHKR